MEPIYGEWWPSMMEIGGNWWSTSIIYRAMNPSMGVDHQFLHWQTTYGGRLRRGVNSGPLGPEVTLSRPVPRMLADLKENDGFYLGESVANGHRFGLVNYHYRYSPWLLLYCAILLSLLSLPLFTQINADGNIQLRLDAPRGCWFLFPEVLAVPRYGQRRGRGLPLSSDRFLVMESRVFKNNILCNNTPRPGVSPSGWSCHQLHKLGFVWCLFRVYQGFHFGFLGFLPWFQ